MAMIEDIMKDYIKNDNSISKNTITKPDKKDIAKQELCEALTKLINNITSGKVSIDDCKIKIDTVTDSRIKSKIKYVGENRKWCNKWGL